MLPGQTSIVNLGGERVGEMVVEPRAALATRLPDRREGYRGYPTSLLGRIAYIKQVFLDAQHYRQALNVYAENPSGLRRPEYDRTLEPIAEAIAARRPTLYPANSAVQLRRGIGMKKWIPTRLILYGAHQAYAAADDLAAAGVDILVNVKWPEPPKDPDPEAEISLRDLRLRDRAPSSPAKLAEAGVRFAFYAEDAEDAAEPSDILKGVSAAIDNGLSTHDAVRALTLAAAEIFGVDDRLGSLDAGKIANLLITSGDLFDKEVVTKIVFIDGRKYDVPPKPPSKPAAAETQEPPQ